MTTEQIPIEYSDPNRAPEFIKSDVVSLSERQQLMFLDSSNDINVYDVMRSTTNEVLELIKEAGAHALSGGDGLAQELVSSYQHGPLIRHALFIKKNSGTGRLTMITEIEPDPSKPVHIPVANFVSAPGFEDWAGTGRIIFDDFVCIPSSKVIRDFASRGTPFPPIDGVIAITQPNGLTYCIVHRNGSHRVAAAKARGVNQTISVQGKIVVYQTDKDHIPLPEPR